MINLLKSKQTRRAFVLIAPQYPKENCFLVEGRRLLPGRIAQPLNTNLNVRNR